MKTVGEFREQAFSRVFDIRDANGDELEGEDGNQRLAQKLHQVRPWIPPPLVDFPIYAVYILASISHDSFV